MDTEYINRLRKRNFVCEVRIQGLLCTVLFIDRRFSSPDEAKSEFRAEALRIKEQEGGIPIGLVMHL